jgi:DNA-binding MarR family transcriptional regulator
MRSRMDYTQFLRNSHIFAYAVRDIMERKFLRDTSPLPLTLSQFHLLKLLSINGQHQVTEIAEFLGVSPAAASKNIDKLEGLGLMVRTPSEGDRRATLLSVNSKGRRLVKAYEELKAARLYPILESFKPKEIEELTRLLELISVEVFKLEEPQEEESGNGYCLRCTGYLESDCPVGGIRGGCPYDKVHRHLRNKTAEKV